MPTLKKDCPTLCPVDAKGEIFGKTCLRDWGKCVRSANLDTYGKVGDDCLIFRHSLNSIPVKNCATLVNYVVYSICSYSSLPAI